MPPISWPRLSSRRRWSSWRLSPRASMWSVVSVIMQSTPPCWPCSSVSGIMLIRTLRCEPSARISRVAADASTAPPGTRSSRRVSSAWPVVVQEAAQRHPDQLGAGQARAPRRSARWRTSPRRPRRAAARPRGWSPAPGGSVPRWPAAAPCARADDSASASSPAMSRASSTSAVGVEARRASRGSGPDSRRTCCRRSPGTARRRASGGCRRVHVAWCRGRGSSLSGSVPSPASTIGPAAGGQRGRELVVRAARRRRSSSRGERPDRSSSGWWKVIASYRPSSRSSCTPAPSPIMSAAARAAVARTVAASSAMPG